MPAKKGLTTDDYIAALRETNGNISLAARRLKVERRAVQYAIQQHPTVRAAHDEAADAITDIAEGHLVSAVMRGVLPEVHYWLENKARQRGYGKVDRIEHSGPNGGPIPVIIDRRAALAPIAPRPVGNRDTPGDDQGDHDG